MLSKFRIFKNKTVLITGFNGFKGSWLTIWLNHLGAKVHGVSLENNNKKNHFNLVKNKINIKEHYLDIRDSKTLSKKNNYIKPDFVFHLAAQAIVSESFKNPINNWETNVVGFLNMLETLSKQKKKCIAVFITSDKCYKNYEKKTGYKEDDILGGDDPYSASKASAEILFHSYFKNFLEKKNNRLKIATARAGNVVGGGDWSKNRLIPDCMKSWLSNRRVYIRNPDSTRPWQHVLEALNGYMTLAYHLKYNKKINGQSFNFSSDKIKNIKVIDFIGKIKKNWDEIKWKLKNNNNFHESSLLQLNSSKAKKLLNWDAKLDIDETVKFITDWYIGYKNNKTKIYNISLNQIKDFENRIK